MAGQDSWEGLLEEYGPFVLGLARERLRRAGFGPAEADEVAQEVWLSFWRGGLARVDPDRGIRPYLAVSVLNATRSWLRTQGRRKLREAAYASPGGHPEAPEAGLLLRESSGTLQAALEVLPARERLVLRWTYWEGLSYSEIGTLLGISPEGIGPLLTGARERLREILGKTTPPLRGHGVEKA